MARPWLPIRLGGRAGVDESLARTPAGASRRRRLSARHARMADDRCRCDGTGWAVPTDPEGNKYCAERCDRRLTARTLLMAPRQRQLASRAGRGPLMRVTTD